MKKKSKAKRRETIPLPEGFIMGKLITYYDFGWRFGYLKEVRAAGYEVGIKPIAGYKKSAHNLTWHKVEDCRPVKEVNEEIGPTILRKGKRKAR